MMEVYVLKEIRFDNSVSLATGEWRHQPTDYEIAKGILVESKNMIRNNQETLVHIVKVEDLNLFFEEIFETKEDADRRKEELLRYKKSEKIRFHF